MTKAPPQRRPVFLIGFMGSGKTAVGGELAALLDIPFVDLDDVIEAAAGKSIPEIFAESGEEHFRRLERSALAEVAASPAAVVATGGGAPCHDGGLELMRERGMVIALTAPLDELLERAGDPGSRPLLQQPRERIRALCEERTSVYRQAHVGISTEGLPIEAVALVARDLVEKMRPIPQYAFIDAAVVSLGERSYPVIVAPGALDRVGELARRRMRARCRRVGLVSDTNVAPLYAPRVRSALEEEGFEVVEATVPAGEQAKQIESYTRLAEQLVEAGMDRTSAVVALGGGVVGDLAGFVAATLFRGISVIQVPTTLLAMVDAAIGGKTGINLPSGKNLVGSFWQPSFALADPEVLATLPVRERRAAFGELVKYALLDGEDLFGAVEQLAPALGRGAQTDSSAAPDAVDPSARAEAGQLPPEISKVVRYCAAIKSWIVTRDEREQTGERALLNLGHTVGHAIETASGYGPILHGEAVALGLIAACRVSARLGLAAASLEERVRAILARAGLDTDLDSWLEPANEAPSRPGAVQGPRGTFAHLQVDKKRTGRGIDFVALRDVGVPTVVELELGDLVRILHPQIAV